MNDPNDSSQPVQYKDEDASNSSTSISSEAAGPSEMPAVDPNSLRGTVGAGMDRFSHLVNDNLVAARYGVFAGITLLTVYGLSQTPLFFRYRTVADVPGKCEGRDVTLARKHVVIGITLLVCLHSSAALHYFSVVVYWQAPPLRAHHWSEYCGKWKQ